LVLVVVLLAACGPAKGKGSAWPAPSKTADDGGESIAPRESSPVAAAIEKSAEPVSEKKADADVAAPAAAKPDAKPDAKPSISPPILDDVIFSDEILIDLDD
jgi:hypothetical protein